VLPVQQCANVGVRWHTGAHCCWAVSARWSSSRLSKKAAPELRGKARLRPVVVVGCGTERVFAVLRG